MTWWLQTVRAAWARVDAWLTQRDARAEKDPLVEAWAAELRRPDIELGPRRMPGQRNRRYQGRHRAQPSDFPQQTTKDD